MAIFGFGSFSWLTASYPCKVCNGRLLKRYVVYICLLWTYMDGFPIFKVFGALCMFSKWFERNRILLLWIWIGQPITDPKGSGSEKILKAVDDVFCVNLLGLSTGSSGRDLFDYHTHFMFILHKKGFLVWYLNSLYVLGNISKGDTVTVFNCHLASLRNQKCLGRQIIHDK